MRVFLGISEVYPTFHPRATNLQNSHACSTGLRRPCEASAFIAGVPIVLFHLIFDFFDHVVLRSLFHVSTMNNVAVKLLVEKYFVSMSAVALCSSRESPFLEVRFDRRWPRREAEHPGPYCLILAKRCT